MNIDSETFGFQPNARHPEVEPRPKPDHLGLNGAEKIYASSRPVCVEIKLG